MAARYETSEGISRSPTTSKVIIQYARSLTFNSHGNRFMLKLWNYFIMTSFSSKAEIANALKDEIKGKNSISQYAFSSGSFLDSNVTHTKPSRPLPSDYPASSESQRSYQWRHFVNTSSIAHSVGAIRFDDPNLSGRWVQQIRWLLILSARYSFFCMSWLRGSSLWEYSSTPSIPVERTTKLQTIFNSQILTDYCSRH